jgi:8-oxo-dGTP pyrophosphatase MutT (NUDIX family)
MGSSADGAAQRYPVSVKGVVIDGGRVALLKNERDEWELPGGKLELREDPRSCVEREIFEELGWVVEAEEILDCWQYEVKPGVVVLIVTYGCRRTGTEVLGLSDEHVASGLFAVEEIDQLRMPEGYRASIRSWYGAIGT